MTADRWGATSSIPHPDERRVRDRIFGRTVLAALAGVIFLLAVGVGRASAQLPSGQLEEFDYTVSNVKGLEFPGVLYSTGSIGTGGGSVRVQSGALSDAELLSNAWGLIPAGNATLNAEVTDFLLVTGPTLTGTATVPPGTTMTVTPVDTGRTINITNGPFSIPTGLRGLGAQPPKSGNQIVECRGSASSCQAQINLAGGARDREIMIRLTDTSLTLRSVKAPSRGKHAAYTLTDGRYASGRSEYSVILNAARSCPRGSHLILTFARST